MPVLLLEEIVKVRRPSLRLISTARAQPKLAPSTAAAEPSRKRIRVRAEYKLLWVAPNTGGAALNLEQLDENLQPLHASVMLGISTERAVSGQTAIRLYGAADEATVLAALTEAKYTVVDAEVRL
jgi:hypothetical protein